MKIEQFTSKDLLNISHLHQEGWPDFTHNFEFYIKNQFCYPIKVTDGNNIVGIGSSIDHKNTTWLAHIIVDKGHRNKGIGNQITRYLVENAQKRSVETILLIATKMGEPIYKKIGFKVISNYMSLKKETPWNNMVISKNILPYSEKYYSQILKLDSEISGENRENIIRMYIDKSMLYVDEEIVRGYYLPGLEEGLIFANDEKAGIELLKFKHALIDEAVLQKKIKME